MLRIPDYETLPEVLRVVEEEELWWQTAKLDGKREGVIEGKIEGKLEGEASLLRMLLEMRYEQPLPEWALSRLDGATAENIQGWARQLFSKPESLEELLGKPEIPDSQTPPSPPDPPAPPDKQ